jgi:hypothetical protein
MSVDADNRSSYSGRRSERRDGFLKMRSRRGCMLPDKKKARLSRRAWHAMSYEEISPKRISLDTN